MTLKASPERVDCLILCVVKTTLVDAALLTLIVGVTLMNLSPVYLRLLGKQWVFLQLLPQVKLSQHLCSGVSNPELLNLG